MIQVDEKSPSRTVISKPLACPHLSMNKNENGQIKRINEVDPVAKWYVPFFCIKNFEEFSPGCTHKNKNSQASYIAVL